MKRINYAKLNSRQMPGQSLLLKRSAVIVISMAVVILLALTGLISKLSKNLIEVISFVIVGGWLAFKFVVHKRHTNSISGLALDNGWRFYSGQYQGGYLGKFFGGGSEKRIVSSLAIPAGDLLPEQNQFDFGNCVVGSGRSSYGVGFVRVKLGRHLPRILIDNRKNNLTSIQILNEGYSGGQEVKLTSEFDKIFKVYTPVGYDRDLFEIFTPDLMQLFIDKHSDCDFEIIDDELYIYRYQSFDLLNQATYEMIFDLVLQLAEKIDQRSVGYRDYRSSVWSQDSPNEQAIAVQGRRLLRKNNIVATVVAIVIIIPFTIFTEETMIFLNQLKDDLVLWLANR